MERIETVESIETDEVGNALLNAGAVMIGRDEIGDPEGFLAGERGKAWIDSIMEGIYYTKWYDHQRSPYELKKANKIAGKVLDLKRHGADMHEIEALLEGEFFDHGAEDCYAEEHESDVDQKIAEIAEALDAERDDDETIPEMDIDEWQSAVRDVIVERMYDSDDSSVMDMFGSFDRCEVTIRLHEEDLQCDAHTSDFDSMDISRSLQRALAFFGYTVADYRRMTGSRRKASNTLKRVPVRPQTLATEDELREIVSEACSSYFSIVLYAIVPLTHIFELDLSKPIAMDGYSMATYCGGSGTFYEIRRDETIILMPGTVEVTEPWGYSPQDICGLVMSPYHADMKNVEIEERESA